MVVGAWVGGIASVGGLVAMVLIAIDKIGAGQGLDTYRTKWMVEDNWIGFLVFLVFIVVTTVVVLAAAIIGWFQRRSEQREVQQLHAKYSEGHHG